MTRPTARVLALLEILQAGGTRTVADLADRLGVDERTVRRYIGHLIDLDVPVRSVRGRYGGYRLAPGYRMPPLMLTDEEALAVLLGLVVGRRAGLVTTSVAAAESAAAKVRRVLPEALGRRLDALLATADFTAPARPVVIPETSVLLMLAEAARDRRPVAVSYTAWKGRRSERTVHPYGIVAHSGRWYVTGADSASGEVRTFRLDRIETATVLPGSFEVPVGFDPAARVLSGLAGVPYLHEVSLRVQGTAEQVRHRLPPGLATVRELPAEETDRTSGEGEGGGWVRVQLRAERLEWVPSVLAWLDLPFVIEYPDALRDHVRALAHRLATCADVVADATEGAESARSAATPPPPPSDAE
ncbi:helix-turn-helix transcriptional regulator [Streptomyces melanosporofaciens]|uniref:Predicted DNA-binding transcriptional regulator YafY, contains an HTH and WYL domains n=1 Tax=Streptomyces melanosporofaciens TaxID=67327 RepID=A0A1H4YL86_STRMJ|nr:YafY family protein [Streptomyces melanosporofaciens]SED17831.1 Predicted DNA-binding transcriptional regulator YafY, contains an HTH and WYL domains [Streptomyces melanosporofaciens]